ncbi:MAG: hypothetical protein JXB60_01290 [Candidatus Cloacimonetes bacterium]|nr:hypothetical protein [Candidatus Cloacimonadota bacterium]
MPLFFSRSLGWILGSLAAVARMFWLARSMKNSLEAGQYRAKVNAIKGYYISFILLIVYSIIVVKFIKPDILFFGLGLLSVQISIYVIELFYYLKKSGYFRGNNG